MSTHQLAEFASKIGSALSLIRRSKGLTQQFVAQKVGFRDQSAYGKLERGTLDKVDLLVLLKLCVVLDCNLVHLMLLAGVDIFETKIQSGSEFIKSLNSLTPNQQELLMNEFKKILDK